VTLLFIGDIFGKVGRDLVQRALKNLVLQYDVDLVVANAENAAGGFGVTRETGDAILKTGVDVMTSGNHVWDKKEVLDYIEHEPRLLRPANYPHSVPGCGSLIARTRHGDEVGILNLMGRVFMTAIDDPFRTATREIERIRERTPLVLVDFHAEATSEKIAMGWHLDGTATAVVGTHTHVQTADDQILPQGTAYITDVGMTGPHDGIIGVERGPVINRFLTGLPARFESASGLPKLHAVVIEADATTGRATKMTRLSLSKADIEALQK
jgi:2',3'-cyclic-nucleotide 2'-phosphodiesterase